MKQPEPYDQDADDVEPLPPFCTERHPRTGVCCFGDVGHLDDHKSSALTGEQTWPRELTTPAVEPIWVAEKCYPQTGAWTRHNPNADQTACLRCGTMPEPYDQDDARAQVCAAFGVTVEEVDALDRAERGPEHRAERAAFEAEMLERAEMFGWITLHHPGIVGQLGGWVYATRSQREGWIRVTASEQDAGFGIVGQFPQSVRLDYEGASQLRDQLEEILDTMVQP